MRATACIVACVPTQAYVLFRRHMLRSYRSQPPLGGRRKPKKCHARISDGDAAIVDVSSYPLCFRSLRVVVVARGRSRRWQRWACERHDFCRGANTVIRCDMIYMYSRERGCCPPRHSLRFTIYRLWWLSIMPRQPRIASGTLAERERAMQVR